MNQYLNSRIVLTTKNNVSYAGIVKNVMKIDLISGLLLELDPVSGVAIWCPEDYINEITPIPIHG